MFIPEIDLAIEFDEVYHKRQVKGDLIRQHNIEQTLKCSFVRVSELESKGIQLGKVLKEVILKYTQTPLLTGGN